MQAVLSFVAPAGGVTDGAVAIRCGVAVEATALEHGLTVAGAQAVQWRRLPLRPMGDRVWVELAIVGARGRVRVRRAGRARRSDALDAAGKVSSPLAGAVPAGAAAAGVAQPGSSDRPGATAAVAQGPCYRFWSEDSGTERVSIWEWCDGSVDRRVRRRFVQPQELDGERYAVGEAWTEDSAALANRWHAILAMPPECLPRLALGHTRLPPGAVGDPRLRTMREHLQRVAQGLRELPGRRGAGDFARSGDVVTNLEFDTPLALLRLGLAMQDERLLDLARRSAWHLVDRDLDPRTGLPFPHGRGHRSGVPAPGHAWLTGLLLVGTLTADLELLTAAGQIAHGLAGSLGGRSGAGGSDGLGAGEGATTERARDYAWPLLELESYLQMVEDPLIAGAADRQALSLAQRFDPRTRTFRFGEGELEAERGRVYFERAWVTGGLVLPALRAHLLRRPDRQLQRIVETATEALVDGIGSRRIGPEGHGIATHWRVASGRPFAQHVAVQDPKALLMLEGLPVAQRRRLLRRREVFAWMSTLPPPADPDLPTTLSMVARCRWIYD